VEFYNAIKGKGDEKKEGRKEGRNAVEKKINKIVK
jgi:hypothetical protein